MPFPPDVKTQLFIRCNRLCCLCLKQCGINIEVAHIIDESAGGSNSEENGIPLCFDCHQEIGSYNDRHPRGNKIRPEELRARRDRVYAMVESGLVADLRPVNLTALLDRQTTLKTNSKKIPAPTVGQVLAAVARLDPNHWDDSYLILLDSGWENAFVQVCLNQAGLFMAEYRDGATQLQYRAEPLSIEAVKLMLLSYMRVGDELMRVAIKWKDITAKLQK